MLFEETVTEESERLIRRLRRLIRRQRYRADRIQVRLEFARRDGQRNAAVNIRLGLLMGIALGGIVYSITARNWGLNVAGGVVLVTAAIPVVSLLLYFRRNR